MASDEQSPSGTLPDELVTSAGATADPPPAAGGAPPRRRARAITRIAFLVFGLLVALYLGTQGAQEQHVRIVLGSAAPGVTALDLRYVAADGDVMREASFTYPNEPAPRIISHEPKLPNGEYQLQIDVDTRDGRRAIQRQVRLGGGSTQIDVSSALARENSPPEQP